MVHVPEKFRENTSMRYTVRKLNVTDGHTDGQMDRRSDGGTGGVAISPVCGPTARREIKKSSEAFGSHDFTFDGAIITG